MNNKTKKVFGGLVAILALVDCGHSAFAAPPTKPCPSLPSADTAQSQIVFLIDESAYRPKEYLERLEAALARIPQYGARIVVWKFAGAEAEPQVVADTVMPSTPTESSMASWDSESKVRRDAHCAKTQFAEERQRIVDVVLGLVGIRFNQHGGKSPILEAIEQAASPYGDRTVDMYVLTDGLENSTVASFYRGAGAGVRATEILAAAKAAGIAPSMVNVNISFSGIGLRDNDVESDRLAVDVLTVKQFWIEYARVTGATLREISTSVPLRTK